MTFTLLSWLHYLDPLTASWPVALLMLFAAIYLAHRLYRLISPRPKRRFHISKF